MIKRKKTRQVLAGNVAIGGDSPITVQSMLSIRASDIDGSVAQAVRLEEAGCEILRAAIPTLDDIRLIPALKEKISIPLVADIHFD